MRIHGHQSTAKKNEFVLNAKQFGSVLCMSLFTTHVIGSQIKLNKISVSQHFLPSTVIDAHHYENPVGIDLVLDALIKYLILLLDAPVDSDSLKLNATQVLDQSAETLITGYQAFGLESNLTTAEREQGVEDAHQVLNILKNHSGELSLDMAMQNDLENVTESLKQELELGQ